MREPQNNNYKPIFQSILNLLPKRKKATTREITERLKPIKEGIEAITFPAYLSIQASEKPLERRRHAIHQERSRKYLRKLTAKDAADTTYGLYDKAGKFYISNKLAIIDDNDLVVGKDEYEGTPGLWELIVLKKPNNCTAQDYDNYAKLMIKTNTLYRGNNPENTRPKSSKSYKWMELLRPIWESRKAYEGKGVVVIPSDPNGLFERLDLLLASK